MARILIVDDDRTLRSMLRDLLLPARHEVLEAANGREALSVMRRQPADIVITDMLMPEMEGVETIRALRRDFPSAKIIAMSGGGVISAGHYLNIAVKLGVGMTLQKPFSPPELFDVINQLLDPPPTDKSESRKE